MSFLTIEGTGELAFCDHDNIIIHLVIHVLLNFQKIVKVRFTVGLFIIPQGQNNISEPKSKS